MRKKQSRLIPKNAKRVYKGIMFDVYHWRQRMFDGSYATFEGIKRLNTVLVIPAIDGKVALLRESQPRMPTTYSFVAGKIERGETPINAARRELQEETGYKAKSLRLIFTYNPDIQIDWKIYVYVATGCRLAGPQKLDPGEKIKVVPMDFNRFINTVLYKQGRFDHYIKEKLFCRIRDSASYCEKFKRLLFGKG